MTTIAVEILTNIGKGYITQKGVCFLNSLDGLKKDDFKNAIFLLKNLESMLKFDPDQKLIDLINVKYEKFIDYHHDWKSLDDLTKLKFADELLFGDMSIENLIRRFFKKAYEQDGYVDQTIRSIIKKVADVKEKKMVYTLGPSGEDPMDRALETYEICENMKIERKNFLIKECREAESKCNEFYEKLLSVEYKATTLILFGFVILSTKTSLFSEFQNISPEQIIQKMKEITENGEGFKFQTEIKMTIEQHAKRLNTLKGKMDAHKTTLDPLNDPILDQGVKIRECTII